jgi:hypothetical protein
MAGDDHSVVFVQAAKVLSKLAVEIRRLKIFRELWLGGTIRVRVLIPAGSTGLPVPLPAIPTLLALTARPARLPLTAIALTTGSARLPLTAIAVLTLLALTARPTGLPLTAIAPRPARTPIL